MTRVINAKQKCDIITADIPNVFVQTSIKKNDEQRIIMKIRGRLADLLVNLDHSTFAGYTVIKDKDESILYVIRNKALYSMLKLTLLYCKKFRKDVESIGFKVNPYSP